MRSSFWKAARARFMPLLCEKTLPLSLCLSLQARSAGSLAGLLQFLSPITTPTAWKSSLCEGHFIPQRMPVTPPAAGVKLRQRHRRGEKNEKAAHG